MKKFSVICLSLCLLIFCSLTLTAYSGLPERHLFEKFGVELPQEFELLKMKQVFYANNQGGFHGDGDHYAVYKIENPPTQVPKGFKKPDDEIHYRKYNMIGSITPSTCGYEHYLRVPEKYRPDWDRDFYWQYRGLYPTLNEFNDTPYTWYSDELFIIYQPHNQYLFILARLQ